MKRLLIFIIFLWELPQNILGIFIWFYFRGKIQKHEKLHNRYFFKTPNFGISLGSFIFWSQTDNAIILIQSNNKEHEFGHSVQSLFFGPLYLIIIGLPSILRVIYGSLYFSHKKEKWANYYKGYPENWADKLGMKYY